MSDFTLDKAGGAEVLKEMAADAIRELARHVASNAATDVVGEHVTDRFVATVSVPAYRQAKDGALTRAASAAGLEVRLK